MNPCHRPIPGCLNPTARTALVCYMNISLCISSQKKIVVFMVLEYKIRRYQNYLILLKGFLEKFSLVIF